MKAIVSLFILMAFIPISTLASISDPLIFGVHPFKKPNKIYKMFKPLANHLSEVLEKDIKIVIGKSYSEILEKHRTGEVNFGYFGPASYVIARKQSGVVPLARIIMNGRGAFKGVIVVKSASAMTELAQLKGKRFAFGDHESTLSHYVPHHMLMREGIYLADLKKYAFTGNHDNVALNVLNGTFDAGGMKPAVAQHYLNKGLRILVESEWIPEHLFAASNKFDIELRKKLLNALLETESAVLKSIKSAITGIEAAKDEDYHGLREIINDVELKDPVPR